MALKHNTHSFQQNQQWFKPAGVFGNSDRSLKLNQIYFSLLWQNQLCKQTWLEMSFFFFASIITEATAVAVADGVYQKTVGFVVSLIKQKSTPSLLRVRDAPVRVCVLTLAGARWAVPRWSPEPLGGTGCGCWAPCSPGWRASAAGWKRPPWAGSRSQRSERARKRKARIHLSGANSKSIFKTPNQLKSSAFVPKWELVIHAQQCPHNMSSSLATAPTHFQQE